eukprot:1060559-Amphidinium_carterae.1
MIADVKGVPLEFGEFTSIPYYKRVSEQYRARRFQMNKLKIMQDLTTTRSGVECTAWSAQM